VPRLSDRYALDLSVELITDGHRRLVALQDLSRSGMFLRLAQPLPIGARVRVAINPSGTRFITAARVTHCLDEVTARALGRSAGIGIAFCEPTEAHDHLFALAVDRLLRARRATTAPSAMHIVVADPDTRLLEQMSTALDEAGFTVATATTGMEALAACLRRTPDVVLLDRALPMFDGFGVLDQLAQDATLMTVPAIISSCDPADAGPAFDRGARDFIVKPFAAVELIARARRLVTAVPASARVVLRGTLADITLPALLTLLEQERKTGRLVLTADHTAWLDLSDGRIVGAGSSAPTADARTTLFSLLDWTRGAFELTAVSPPRHDSTLAMPITHLLLEHARLRDESSRVH
jgi:CheY-like chemotaxis protein